MSWRYTRVLRVEDSKYERGKAGDEELRDDDKDIMDSLSVVAAYQ